MVWMRPGGNREADNIACVEQASRSPVTSCMSIEVERGVFTQHCTTVPSDAIYSACIRARGYTLVPATNGSVRSQATIEQRDSNCIYSADGVLIKCGGW